MDKLLTMDKLILTTEIYVKQESELTAEERTLVETAKKSTFQSYAPYSGFHVGAALMLDDGTIISGSNQENCAYPSGTCAERTAVFYANSQYPEKAVKSLCIAARDTSGEFTENPIPPCGSCRQVLLETEKRSGKPMKILMYGTSYLYVIESANLLLPLQFDKEIIK
jgi:cytidine deaminase